MILDYLTYQNKVRIYCVHHLCAIGQSKQQDQLQLENQCLAAQMGTMNQGYALCDSYAGVIVSIAGVPIIQDYQVLVYIDFDR